MKETEEIEKYKNSYLLILAEVLKSNEILH